MQYIQTIQSISVFRSKAYLKLDEDPNYTPQFLVSWIERKFWKNFNRSHYGWKFLGSYHYRKSYHEGAVRASRNASLGSSLLASVGPAARLTKKIFDPMYKWAYRKELANISFTIDQLNRKAKRHLVQPEKQANRDEFEKFQYETSQVYQRQGEQDFEDGYYDQSIYEQYYEDYEE